MRKVYFFVSLLLTQYFSYGQVSLPHLDPVNYTVGQGLQTQPGWTTINTGDDLLIASGSLAYSGLEASTGNKITFSGAGIDAAKSFIQQTSGTVYYSFILNVTSLGSLNLAGGYFTGFTESANTSFGATVWTRLDGAGYDIGINPRTTPANTVWSSGTTAINNIVFIVVSYQIVAGSGNDVVRLWLNPTPGSSEPAATLSATNTGTDLGNLNRILIRQDDASATPSIEMDELRIGTTWASVTPAPASTPTINTSLATLPTFGAVVAGANSGQQTYTVDASNLTTDLSIQAPAGVEVSLTSNTFTGTTGNTITITPVSGTVSATPIYARFSPATATGLLNANIVNSSTGATTKNVAVSGFAIVASPAVQSTISIGTIGNTTIDLTLGGGDGLARLVVAKQGSAVNVDPADGPVYFDGGSIFSNGTDLGSGNYVVYDGNATNIQVTMLTPGTQYHFAVYSYNSSGPGTVNYLTPGAVANATTNTPVYTWSGGNGSWAIPGNWTPARAVPTTGDILQFNDGATVTVTGVPTQTISQLLVTGNTSVNLQGASNPVTLTIAGGTGTDLSVSAGSNLNLNVATNVTNLVLSTGATGVITGNMTFTSAAHKLDAADANGITFNSPAVFTQGSGCAGNVFTNAGTANAIVFASGSTFVQNAGSNPFGLASPASKVIFQTGSLFRFQQNAAPSFSARTYANFEVNFPTFNQSATGGSLVQFDNITIADGTLNLNLTGGISIRGNLSVATGEVLTFSPAIASTVYFDGATSQTITNNGTLTFSPNATLEVINAQGVSLNTPLTIGGPIYMTTGVLNTTTANVLTIQPGGAASSGDIDSYIVGPVIIETNSVTPFTIPVGRTDYLPVIIIPASAAASSYRAEALLNTVIDCAVSNIEEIASNYYWDITKISGADASIQLEYIAGLTNWTNAGIPDNSDIIFIIHKTGTPTPCWEEQSLNSLAGDESSGTLTTNVLSSFSPFTFGYGNLVVVPVRFGNIKATAQGNGVKIDWSNFTETDVVHYKIERSVNGQPFVALNSINARLNNGSRADYSYFDASPVNGINLYRIQSLELDGKQVYSIIVRVDTRASDRSTITIYPNPAAAAEVSFQATDLPKGNYTLQVYNTAGQQVHSKKLAHAGGFITELLELPAGIKAGMYHLQIISAEMRLSKSFMIR